MTNAKEFKYMGIVIDENCLEHDGLSATYAMTVIAQLNATESKLIASLEEK